MKTICGAYEKEGIKLAALMKKGYARAKIRQAAFKAFENKTIVDFGCHVGMWSHFLSRFADKVVGIDDKESCIERAESMNSVLKIPNVVFIQGNVHSMRDICKQHNCTAIFAQKVLGRACRVPADAQIFHAVCWELFDVVVSDCNFQADTKYNWIVRDKIDSLYVFSR